MTHKSAPASHGRMLAGLCVVLLVLLGAAEGYTPYFTNVRVTLPGCPYVVVRFYVNTTTEFPVSYVEGLLDVTNLGTIHRNGSLSPYGALADLGFCNSFVVSDNAQLPGVVSLAAFSPAVSPTRLNFTTYGVANFTAPAIVAQIVIGTAAQAVQGTLTATLPTYIHYTSLISAGLTDDPTCPVPCDRFDLYRDRVINAFDESILLGDWGPCVPPATCYGQCRSDFDNSGTVNSLDNLQVCVY